MTQPNRAFLQTVRGMHDILPDEILLWHRVESLVAEWMQRYGYEEIRTPIIETAELFYRGVGQTTDAVGKEMYVFPDKGGELLALRPELTAPVARAIVQHNLSLQRPLLRLWYYGPCFRYERPQKGRQRQFHQVGAECLGVTRPDADVEIITLAWNIITALLAPTNVTLSINTLGTVEEQHHYRRLLIEYLDQYRSDLSPVSQQRLQTNPLRILDSKEERDRRIIATAPHILDCLGPQSRAHYENVLELLSLHGIVPVEDPYLVRGLDYYTHTVFEFRSARLGSQDAIGGGGRYDNLLAQIGGNPLPGVGFGIGVERLLLAMEKHTHTGDVWNAAVFVAASETSHRTMHTVAQWLRAEGIPCVTDLQFRSLKAQLRHAHRMRYALCIIIPATQDAPSMLIVKDMRSGVQQELPMDRTMLCEHVQRLLELQP